VHQPEKIEQLHTRFTALHHELQRDTAQLASDAIEKVLQA
jgi:lipid-A-disaccharide synthase